MLGFCLHRGRFPLLGARVSFQSVLFSMLCSISSGSGVSGFSYQVPLYSQRSASFSPSAELFLLGCLESRSRKGYIYFDSDYYSTILVSKIEVCFSLEK